MHEQIWLLLCTISFYILIEFIFSVEQMSLVVKWRRCCDNRLRCSLIYFDITPWRSEIWNFNAISNTALRSWQHVWRFGCGRKGSEVVSKSFVLMSSVISNGIQMCCSVWVTLERQLFTPHNMRFGTSYSNRPVKMLVISSILKKSVFMLYHLQFEFRQATICSHNCRLHYIEMKHSPWNHPVTWELF